MLSQRDTKLNKLVDERATLLFRGGISNLIRADELTEEIIALAMETMGTAPPVKMIIEVNGMQRKLQSYKRGNARYVPLEDWQPEKFVYIPSPVREQAEKNYGLDPNRK